MAASTGPMLAATGISFGNQWLGNGQLKLNILVAGAVATGGLVLLEKVIGGPAAAGIAWIAVVTVFFVGFGGGKSPVENVKKLTGL